MSDWKPWGTQGVVASTAQLLYGFGCNIIESDQFTDTSVDQFFQRITFDYSSLHVGLGNRPILERAIQELASRCVLSLMGIMAVSTKKMHDAAMPV